MLRAGVVTCKRLAGTGITKVPVFLHVLHKGGVVGRWLQANPVLAPSQDFAQKGFGQGLLNVRGVNLETAVHYPQ